MHQEQTFSNIEVDQYLHQLLVGVIKMKELTDNKIIKLIIFRSSKKIIFKISEIEINTTKTTAIVNFKIIVFNQTNYQNK